MVDLGETADKTAASSIDSNSKIDTNKKEYFKIESNNEFVPLIGEKEREEDSIEIGRQKGEFYKFKEMSKEEIKNLIEKYERENGIIGHPDFDHFNIDGTKTLGECVRMFIEGICDDDYVVNQKNIYEIHCEKKEQEEIERENYINDELTVDDLFFSGLLTFKEAKEYKNKEFERPDKEIISAVHNKLGRPEDVKISFLKGRLCINKAPTVIFEDDIRDAYNGILSLDNKSNSIEKVSNLIFEKLKPLFGCAENEEELSFS